MQHIKNVKTTLLSHVVILQITHRGLTGLVNFDSNGKRRSKRALDILNIGENGVEKVITP